MRHCVNEDISVWETESKTLSESLREAAEMLDNEDVGVSTLFISHSDEHTSLVIHTYSKN